MIRRVLVVHSGIFMFRVEKRIVGREAEQPERTYKLALNIFKDALRFMRTAKAILLSGRQNGRNGQRQKLIRADFHVLCPFAVLPFGEIIRHRIIQRIPEDRIKRGFYLFSKTGIFF